MLDLIKSQKFGDFMQQLAEAIEKYCIGKSKSTELCYKRIGARYEAFCKDRGIKWHKAKYHDILAFLKVLREVKGFQSPNGNDRYCNKTIRRALVLISAIYRHNNLDFSIFQPALRLVPVSKKPQKRFTGLIPFDQVEKLFNACDDSKSGLRNKAYLALCLGGALRTSEATGLKIGDLQETSSGTFFVFIASSKTHQPAQQVISESLIHHITRYKKERLKEGAKDTDWFLTTYDAKNLVSSNKQVGKKRMLEVFWRLCELVLDTRLGTHSMRATAITKLIADGIPHRKIQDFSRHSTISMVEYYDKMTNDIEKNVGKALKF